MIPSSRSATSSSPAPRRGSTAVATPLLGRGLQSSPGRRPPPVAGRQAQQDLTQKLRAMDLELERIECEKLDSACHTNSFIEDSRLIARKENVDPMCQSMVVMPAWEAQQMREELARAAQREAEYQRSQHTILRSVCGSDIAIGHSVASCSNGTSLEMTSAAASQAPCPQAQQNVHSSVSAATQDTAGNAGQADSLQSLEDKWREAHSSLHTELTQEISRLREAYEGEESKAARLLRDFEVEFTAALEARATEADRLVEAKLIEAGEGMQRRVKAFEELASDDRSRFAVLEGDTKRRFADLEATLQAERARTVEQLQTFGETMQLSKDNVAALRQRINQLQDESSETKDHLASFRQRVQQLQEDREDAKEQLASLRQRFQQVQEDREDIKEQIASIRQRYTSIAQGSASPASAETEMRRLFTDMDSRLQRLDDSLTTRLQESETRLHVNSAEEVAALRHKVQTLLDSSPGVSTGSSNSTTPAEIERRLQRLEEGWSSRILDSEGRLVTQQRALEGQLCELRHHIGDTETRLQSALRTLEVHTDTRSLEDRLEELHHSCQFEIRAVRDLLEGTELRCSEKMREILQQGLDEAEARSLGATEASVAGQLDAFRAELRVDTWKYTGHHDRHYASLDEVDRQLSQSEEERRLLSEQLQSLTDRQKRQQHLLEDLLSAAARRSSPLGESSSSGAVGFPTMPATEIPEAVARRLDSLGVRVASIEDHVAHQAQTAVTTTSVSARVATLEEHFQDQSNAATTIATLSTRILDIEERIAASAGSQFESSKKHDSASIAAATELAEQCDGRLDALSKQMASIEDRVITVARAETHELVREFETTSLSTRIQSSIAELRTELVNDFDDKINRMEESHSRHQIKIEDVYDGLQKVQEEGVEHSSKPEALACCMQEAEDKHKVLAAELAAQTMENSGAEKSAAAAESIAASLAEEVQSLRHLVDKAETAHAGKAVEMELTECRKG